MTRFAKLSLLLIVAGAFALAGCGGDDNGLSAEDMARLSAADEAKMTADEAKMTADEAKTAADAAQAEAEQAKQDAADAKAAADQASMTPSLAAAWEAIAGEAIESYLDMQITDMAGATGPVSHMQLVTAIRATATKYGIDPAAALAVLEAANPMHESIRRVAANSIVASLHAMDPDPLAATADSVAAALKGDEGSGPPVADVVSTAWEEIAGKAIEDDLAARLAGAGPVSHTTLVMAITATANKYGVAEADLAATLKVLEDINPTHESIRRVAVNNFLDYVHDNGHLAATRESVTEYFAMVSDTSDTSGGSMDGDGDDTDTDTMPDMTKVSYIDDIRMMDDFEMFVMGTGASDDEDDYDTSMLTSTADPDDASYGDDIYTHMSPVTGEFGGKAAANAGIVDIHWAEWGVWGVLREGTIGGTDVMTKAFSGGVEADAPMGSKSGSAVWTGTFVGQHQKAWDANGGTADTQATELQNIAKGDTVSGRAQLTVSFTDKGVGNTMDATFDKFYSQGDNSAAPFTRATDSSIMIDGIAIGKSGDFNHTVEDPGAYGTTAQQAQAMAAGSMVEGQFVGMDGMGAIGAMTLIKEGAGTAVAAPGTPAAVAANNYTGIDGSGEFVIIGSFGAGRNR